MDTQNNILASLDIGTTSIKIIITEFINGQMNIIGVGNEPSKGIKKGVIVDIEETVTSIKRAITIAQEKANKKIQEVIVGLPAVDLEIDYTHVSIDTGAIDTEYDNADIEHMIEVIKEKDIQQGRTLVSVVPEEFYTDGFDGITDPRQMSGRKLEMDAVIYTLPSSVVHNTVKCVEAAGLSIYDLVLEPFALEAVALSEEQSKKGATVIDLGAGQVTSSTFHDGKLKHSYYHPEGGSYITQDISVVLEMNKSDSEKLKRDYGFASSMLLEADNIIEYRSRENNRLKEISEVYLTEIIEARLIQILTSIKDELDAVRARELPGGIVLTGGTASLPGIKELAREILARDVSLYIPNYMGIRYPSFSHAIGLIVYQTKISSLQYYINSFVMQPKEKQSSSDYIITSDNEQVTYSQEPDIYEGESRSSEVLNKLKEMLSSFFGE